jgi:hypothetical protein
VLRETATATFTPHSHATIVLFHYCVSFFSASLLTTMQTARYAASRLACRTSARPFGNLVSDFANDIATHRQANPDLYNPKQLSDMVQDRLVSRDAMLKARTSGKAATLQKWAVAATGVKFESGTKIHGNPSSFRLNGGKKGPIKIADIAGKSSNFTAGFASPGSTEVAYDESDSIIEGAVGHLSGSGKLFLEDAAVGSVNGVGVRGVTNSTQAAAVLKGLLERNHSRYGGSRPITVYAVPELDAKKPVSLVATEVGTSRVVCAGAIDAANLVNTLADAVNSVAPGHLLPCDVHVNGDDVSLVFDSTDADRAKAFGAGTLYAGHHAVLTDSGVSRAWGGVVVRADGFKASDGDVVVGDMVVASRPASNAVPLPSKAVFNDGVIELSGDASAIKAAIDAKLNPQATI